jgi:hypothetical protein
MWDFLEEPLDIGDGDGFPGFEMGFDQECIRGVSCFKIQ